MNVSRIERALFVIAALCVVYRIIRDEWPIGMSIEAE